MLLNMMSAGIGAILFCQYQLVDVAMRIAHLDLHKHNYGRFFNQLIFHQKPIS